MLGLIAGLEALLGVWIGVSNGEPLAAPPSGDSFSSCDHTVSPLACDEGVALPARTVLK